MLFHKTQGQVSMAMAVDGILLCRTVALKVHIILRRQLRQAVEASLEASQRDGADVERVPIFGNCLEG